MILSTHIKQQHLSIFDVLIIRNIVKECSVFSTSTNANVSGVSASANKLVRIVIRIYYLPFVYVKCKKCASNSYCFIPGLATFITSV